MDFRGSAIVCGQNHAVCPPQKVSLRIIPYSSHGPPGADFVLQGYFSLPDLPGRRAPDNGALLTPLKVLGSCRIEAGGCKTDCQAAAKHLRSLSSPQHYPIPHFPRLFRRDRLFFSGQKNNKKGIRLHAQAKSLFTGLLRNAELWSKYDRVNTKASTWPAVFSDRPWQGY